MLGIDGLQQFVQFQIPMRGNEIKVYKFLRGGGNVSNPHEG